jgi:hypothetical protein
MPRFTVKDLLIVTTLIAIGAGALAFVFQNGEEIKRAYGAAVFAGFWFSGGAFIGAGLFLPFKRPWTGAIAGVVFQFLLSAAVTFILYR